jgi:hypothetical protein
MEVVADKPSNKKANTSKPARTVVESEVVSKKPLTETKKPNNKSSKKKNKRRKK